MELELGLALPVHVPRKKFDLNIHDALEPKQALKNTGCGLDFKNSMQTKPEAFDAYGECEENKKLPLLVWSGQPNDGDDRRRQKTRSFATPGKNDDEDDEEIVGWPPIKSWRRKLLHTHHHPHLQGFGMINNGRVGDQRGDFNGVRNSIYVKVKMEGVAIGRKIDLMLFNSYQSLTNTLINMFAKYKETDKDDGPYILLYLDKEGDWLLAGDVPWQIFIDSVQRMEISKQSS